MWVWIKSDDWIISHSKHAWTNLDGQGFQPQMFREFTNKRMYGEITIISAESHIKHIWMANYNNHRNTCKVKLMNAMIRRQLLSINKHNNMNIISKCKYRIDKKMESEQVMAKEACITSYENEKFWVT